MALTEYPLTPGQISDYRRDGFVQLEAVVQGDELVRLRDAVAGAVKEESSGDTRPASAKGTYEQIFIQKVNLWQRHPAVKEFVLNRRFANIAAALSGGPVRLWHDQALFKEPTTGAPTPWHQDAHYWPHQQTSGQLSMWLALKDATIENGCMSFIPGTQALDDIEPVNLAEPQDIFGLAPQFKGVKARTCELKAGSCTFHHGLVFHFAGPNRSQAMREAFVVIYMPDGTSYSGAPHPCIAEGEYKIGEALKEPKFPLLSGH